MEIAIEKKDDTVLLYHKYPWKTMNDRDSSMVINRYNWGEIKKKIDEIFEG